VSRAPKGIECSYACHHQGLSLPHAHSQSSIATSRVYNATSRFHFRLCAFPTDAFTFSKLIEEQSPLFIGFLLSVSTRTRTPYPYCYCTKDHGTNISRFLHRPVPFIAGQTGPGLAWPDLSSHSRYFVTTGWSCHTNMLSMQSAPDAPARNTTLNQQLQLVLRYTTASEIGPGPWIDGKCIFGVTLVGVPN